MRKFPIVREFPVDSLQIYFAASLELQKELINSGFYVPKSPDSRVVMPVPLIYSNFRGWLKKPEPITIERLIPPEWLGLKQQDLGWIETIRGGKKAYELPPEEVYVKVGVSGNAVILSLDIKGYHLERTSIRGVNPEKWDNWAMFYISLEHIDKLIGILEEHLPTTLRTSLGPLAPGGKSEPKRETHQGGKEVTYYVEVAVKDFSLCLGCFDLAQRYLYMKAKEHCRINQGSSVCQDPDNVINKLRLRLKHSPFVDTFAKVGVAKISGKRPQIMVKLVSTKPERIIQGVLKKEVVGKARGDLIHCNHNAKEQYIALDLVDLYRALVATKGYIDKLPKEE